MIAKQKSKTVPAMKTASGTKKKLVLNIQSVLNSTLLTQRALALGQQDDPRRNLDEECGYPDEISVDACVKMYARNGIAKRVVDVYPEECFAVDPVIYEDEKKRHTPFEDKWNTMLRSEHASPLHYLQRVDVRSRIGRLGALLIGIDDGGKLSSPAPGIDERGQATGADVKAELLYLRAFDESAIQIKEIQGDPRNPRFGLPLSYNIILGDVDVQAKSALTSAFQEVHWSRVLHVADNRGTSEVFGEYAMSPVYNRLKDTDKILGSAAEMFYKGGFPGLSIEIDPRVLEALNVEINQEDIDEEMFAYMNGLQRYLSLVGMTAKSLAPQVADPTGNIMAALNAIAMSIGVPLRIFMGSEQAQLASGQDVRTWNRRLRRRQERYLTPLLLRPFIDRLILMGVLPRPQKDVRMGKGFGGPFSYKVWWPDVNMPDDDMKSQVGDRRAASMMKYVTSASWQLMQPSDFFRFILGLSEEEAQEAIDNIVSKPAEINFKPPPGMEPKPADSGTKGNPPSKPPKGGK